MPLWHPLIFLLPLNFDTSGLISLLVGIQYLPHGVPIWMSIAERAPLVQHSPCTNQNSFMTKLMGMDMFATGNSYGERVPLARIAKRVLDLLIAGTALVMFSPLLAFICIGIKLEARSQTVLVRQRAVFTGGEFAIYKFATTASQRGFRRVTRVGALLQNTSMDELPQLLNVLCGQMSMVGPRPRVVDPKRNCHNPMHHATQHHIKPGIIGWAQINRFRSETARVDRVNQSTDVEHWYINNWSIWLDLRILLRAMVYPA